MGKIDQTQRRVPLEYGEQPGRHLPQARLVARRQHNQRRAVAAGSKRRLEVLLQHHMRVHAAEPE